MEGPSHRVSTSDGNVPSSSIIEEARTYPETTGKRLGQIVRFDVDVPDSPPPPVTQLEHFSHEEDSSVRGSNSVLRQPARHALENLLEGNKRFQRGEFIRCRPDMELLEELVQEQAPSAVVLACSDSRCPPELVFDQGLGDLFVVRVSGNTVNDYVMGSIVYAVQQLGVRLVVVLGHSRCGMIARAVHVWAKHEAKKSIDLQQGAAPSVETALPRGSQPRQAQSRAQQPASLPQTENGAPPSRQTRQQAKNGSGLFGRFCSCAGAGRHDAEDGREPQELARASHAAASPSPFSSPSQQHPWGRSSSGGRSSSLGAGVPRSALDRLSINPLGAVIHSIQGAVHHVARTEGRLSHVVSKVRNREELEQLGGTGLQTQDSLGITHARLAKQKRNESAMLFNQIKDMEGVEEVATQNTVLNAKAVLKGLARCCEPAMVAEVEVVAAKFGLEDGAVKVHKRGWYSASAKSFFYE